jgi:hypothetical protein
MCAQDVGWLLFANRSIQGGVDAALLLQIGEETG